MDVSNEVDITIVVITFNRLHSLKRLLKSLDNAIYNRLVRLVISIDFGDNDDIVDYADGFNWKFGEKIIIKHTKNLGLRQHVLYCGDLTNKYENICVLEDDLYVSPVFYSYGQQMVSRFSKESKIAGISLYTHKKNISNNLPFEPLKNDCDIFLMQYAMSWGQIWMKDSWNEFKQWYIGLIQSEKKLDMNQYPKYLGSWSEKSWLKYHIMYCIERNKYFVYPYTSLSTNFGDKGTHARFNDVSFQVPLYYSTNHRLHFNMPENIDEMVHYDSYQEYSMIDKDTEFDIYGEKTIFLKKYVLSSQLLNYKKVNSFSLSLKPPELNYILEVEGTTLFLYDTDIKSSSSNLSKNRNILLEFFYGNLGVKKSFTLFWHQLIMKWR